MNESSSFSVVVLPGRVRGRVRLEVSWPVAPVRELAFFAADDFDPSAFGDVTSRPAVLAAGLAEISLTQPRVVGSRVRAISDGVSVPQWVVAFEMVGPSLVLIGAAEPVSTRGCQMVCVSG